MTEIDARLRRLDEIPAPDLWPPAPRRPSSGGRRRPPRRLAFAAVAVVLAAAVAGGLVTARGGDDRQRQVQATGPGDVATTAVPAPRITRSTSLGRPAGSVAAGFGSVWVGTPLSFDGAVLRIDPSTGEIGASIPTGTASRNLTMGEGAVWSVGGGDGASPQAWLLRIDPATNTLSGRLPLDGAYDVAVGSGSVWVTNARDRVWRVDARRLEVQAEIAIDRPIGVAFGFGAVWVTRPDGGVVERIDPSTNTVTASVPAGRAPTAIAVGERSVWAGSFADGTVSSIDPATNTVVATVQIGGNVQGVAEGGGGLWVATGNAVLRLDATTNAVSPPLEVGQIRDVAASDGAAWVLGQGAGSVLTRME